MPGAAVPSHLHRHGVPHVLAPLASSAGAPYVAVDRFALALYPMLDASTGAEVGLSPRQWRQLGAALRQIHTVPLTPQLTRLVGREAFQPTRRELVADLKALLTTTHHPPRPGGSGAGRVLAGSPGRHSRAGRAGGRVGATACPLVVGHELVQPPDTACFLQGYGKATIDPRLLAYYRVAWAVQDIAAYGEQVLMEPTLGEETRRAAVDGFMDLFEPGNIIDLVHVRPVDFGRNKPRE